jgi:hypothetical protein
MVTTAELLELARPVDEVTRPLGAKLARFQSMPPREGDYSPTATRLVCALQQMHAAIWEIAECVDILNEPVFMIKFGGHVYSCGDWEEDEALADLWPRDELPGVITVDGKTWRRRGSATVYDPAYHEGESLSVERVK